MVLTYAIIEMKKCRRHSKTCADLHSSSFLALLWNFLVEQIDTYPFSIENIFLDPIMVIQVVEYILQFLLTFQTR